MKHYFKNYFRNFDYGLLFVYILLMLFGLVMIYSSSIWVSIVKYEADPDHYYNRQVINIIMAFILFVITVITPYKRFSNKKILSVLLAMMFILEVWLIFKGVKVNGAKSWINLFGLMRFQPSEFAKLFIIIFFAGTFYRKSVNRGSMQLLTFDDVSFPLGMWLFIVIVVGFETDLGALATIVSIALVVVLLVTKLMTMLKRPALNSALKKVLQGNHQLNLPLAQK